MRPILFGGHQERGRRPGTENVPGIIGVGKAAELAMNHLEVYDTRVRSMRDRLEEGLLAAFPNSHLNGHKVNRVPQYGKCRL
jgi:cysteine desulfurase